MCIKISKAGSANSGMWYTCKLSDSGKFNALICTGHTILRTCFGLYQAWHWVNDYHWSSTLESMTVYPCIVKLVSLCCGFDLNAGIPGLLLLLRLHCSTILPLISCTMKLVCSSQCRDSESSLPCPLCLVSLCRAGCSDLGLVAGGIPGSAAFWPRNFPRHLVTGGRGGAEHPAAHCAPTTVSVLV